MGLVVYIVGEWEESSEKKIQHLYAINEDYLG